MSAADLVTLLAYLGTGVLALVIGAWARWALIRFGDEDEVARLRLPVAASVVLLVLLVVLVVAEQSTPPV